jgi:hypothetical protein
MAKKEINFKIILFCFIISFLFLMICSKSSFLYPFNDWVDANCFFTMGKSLFKGKILYVSLFDQKGPLLFFFYGIASLISYRTFIGVFILEVISFTIFLYFAYKVLRMYLNDYYCFFILPIFTMIIITLPAFTHGGSAEEFVLPMLMYGLYCLLYFLKNPNQQLSKKVVFINGLMAGCVAMIKFSLLGFWFAWMMGIFVYFVFHKKWQEGVIDGLIFLLGMFIPIFIWVIYFYVNGALKNFIDSYIWFNILYYPHHDSIIVKMFMVILKPLRFCALNLYFGIPFVIGFVSLMSEDFILKDKMSKWIVLLAYLFLCLGVFFGGLSFRYYYLILTPFVVLGLIRIAIYVRDKYKIFKIPNLIYILLILMLLLISLLISQNTIMLKKEYNQKNLVQYEFSKIIDKKSNPTLLNYGFLDGGFYTVSGIVPNVRYFQKQNVAYLVFPDIILSQNRAIENKKIDFVITRTQILKETDGWMTPYLKENYYEVSSICQPYEGGMYRYTLWEKK